MTPGLYALFGDAGIRDGRHGARLRLRLSARHPGLHRRRCQQRRRYAERSHAFRSSPDLDPETSDLYNLGFSLKFLDGDLVFDVDYTSVEFRGQIEPTGPGDQVGLNENGFTLTWRLHARARSSIGTTTKSITTPVPPSGLR